MDVLEIAYVRRPGQVAGPGDGACVALTPACLGLSPAPELLPWCPAAGQGPPLWVVLHLSWAEPQTRRDLRGDLPAPRPRGGAFGQPVT